MSDIKKGSEFFRIVDKKYDESNFKLDGSDLCFEYRKVLFQELEKKVVVPEEKWQSKEERLEELEEKMKKIKTLIETMPDGLELDSSDIPSINVSMLKDTKFLLFRKDRFDGLKEELRKAV